MWDSVRISDGRIGEEKQRCPVKRGQNVWDMTSGTQGRVRAGHEVQVCRASVASTQVDKSCLPSSVSMRRI